MNAKAPTLAAVRATLAEHAPGLTIRKEDCGEYRVTFTQEAIAAAFPEMTRAERIEKAESLAAYESDITSAYETGKAMFRTGLAPAPLKLSGFPATAEAATVRRDNVEYHAGRDAWAANETKGSNPYPAEGERAARWNLGWQEACDKGAPVRETIDMTPTWAAVAPIFVACLEDGTETGRRSARLELNRMAGLADERNAFAERLAAIRAALDSDASPHARLASIRATLDA